MWPTTFSVLLPTLVAGICLGRSTMETSEPDPSTLVETAIDILESCYADQISTMGVAGASAEIIIRAMSSRGIVIPITLIDETSRLVSDDPIVRSLSQHKLRIFAITLTDPSAFVKTLIQVKNSIWWNHMASFILIGWSGIENGCSNAFETLWQAWKMNVLNAKFLCLHQTRGKLIYTFNPYTSKAPVPWHHEKTYKGMNDHVWTLFVREYREDGSRCDSLDFDKTSDLGGYEIRASVRGVETWWSADVNKKPPLFNQVQNSTAQILIGALNATWKILPHPQTNRPARDEKGRPTGEAAEVIDGNSDICFNYLSRHMWTEYKTTYPYLRATITVMSQYSGHKSQLEKIISTLDRSSRYGVVVILLITLCFFKFYVRKPLIRTLMNLVLIVCNAALPRLPVKSAPRIFLGSLFIFSVTIVGIYQGRFSSMLTKDVRRPNINSINELARSDHTIHGIDSWKHFFNRSAFEGRYVVIQNYNCTGYVLRDSKTVCVDFKIRVINNALKFQLHLSRKSMAEISIIHLIRPDWPLENRVNTIYSRAAESGIQDPLIKSRFSVVMNALRSYEAHGQDQAVKVLTLRHINFAFVFLAIGLVCATIIFIFEVTIFDTAIANPRSRIRQRIRLRK